MKSAGRQVGVMFCLRKGAIMEITILHTIVMK